LSVSTAPVHPAIGGYFIFSGCDGFYTVVPLVASGGKNVQAIRDLFLPYFSVRFSAKLRFSWVYPFIFYSLTVARAWIAQVAVTWRAKRVSIPLHLIVRQDPRPVSGHNGGYAPR